MPHVAPLTSTGGICPIQPRIRRSSESRGNRTQSRLIEFACIGDSAVAYEVDVTGGLIVAIFVLAFGTNVNDVLNS
jgi:hypothetical protein